MPPLLSLPTRMRLAAVLPFLAAALLLSLFFAAQGGEQFSESAVTRSSSTPGGSLTAQAAKRTARDFLVGGSGAPEYITTSAEGGRKGRTGLAGATQTILRGGAPDEDDEAALSFTVQHAAPHSSSPSPPLQSSLSSPPSDTLRHSRLWPALRTHAERGITRLGDLLLGLFGLEDEEWDSETSGGDGGMKQSGMDSGAGATLAGWSESSVIVERTKALYPSRPSSFGPHLVSSSLRGSLYPLPSVASSDSYGCFASPPASSLVAPRTPDDEGGWIALVQRGHCAFSDKVRFAQKHGAKAVVFGDMEESEGGIRGGKGLLTPWSPDDTSDISIPSSFVSRASYLALLRAWQDEQRLVLADSEPGLPASEMQTNLLGELGVTKPVVGLEVVLSKEEMLAWPLLDLLFLLLFLPSLLTLVTVFTQRVRLARAAKAERAPKDAVARLPVFKWGDTEKAPTAEAEDEERMVGTSREEREQLSSSVEEAGETGEATPLLHPAVARGTAVTTPPHQNRREYAASPFASGSSVPIEGLLAAQIDAGAAGPEVSQEEEEAAK
ncbi:hypothetical protein JCM10213v2_000963 [Rhodosporidiobolus nylandii]